MEVITILPIVIPPIVLIVGVDGVTPLWLKSSQWLLALIYVVLAMPYVYARWTRDSARSTLRRS